MIALVSRRTFAVMSKPNNSVPLWSRAQEIYIENKKGRGREREGVHGIKIGDSLEDFVCLSKTHLPELDITQLIFKHKRTGALAVHVDAEDLDNCFAVTFKTPSVDSSGVPHILEHTTLCGSREYPVRDPFFNMLKRSLNTFMNAMTASDHTMYPFSTQNEKDFANLMSVYCDATFHPKLTQMDFFQEGHRLDFEVAGDTTSPLIYKGIVYNEMKGTLGDNDNLFMTRLSQRMLPGTIYQHVSGGDPPAIPSLTYEGLKSFHAKHYHPSNAMFFTYGDLPVSGHYKYLNECVLSAFPDSESQVLRYDHVQKWDKPRRQTIYCPLDTLATNPDKQVHVAVSMLTCKSSDLYESSLLSVLSSLLLSGSSAPFYAALIDSHLAPLLSGGCGFDNSTRDTTFTVGVQGIAVDQVPEVESVIWKTLREVSNTGFSQKQIDAILHQYELSIKSSKTGFGLGLLYGTASSWVGEADMVQAAKVQEVINRLKADLAPGKDILQNKIKEYLLDNPHTLTLIMEPDSEFIKKSADTEKEILKMKKEAMSEDHLKEIVHVNTMLEEAQSKVGDPNVLPTIHLSDIELRPIPTKITEQLSQTGKKLHWVHEPTKGLVYLRSSFSLDTLPLSLRPYLPLFTSTLTSMGAGDSNYIQQQLDLKLYTGGISSSSTSLTHYSDEMDAKYKHLLPGAQRLILRTSCLERNFDRSLSLLSEIIENPRFDDINYLKRRISSTSSALLSSIADSGINYASSWASASLSSVYKDCEIRNGFTQVQFMQQLANDGDDGAKRASEALKEILRHIRGEANGVSIVATDDIQSRIFPSLNSFLQKHHSYSPSVILQDANEDLSSHLPSESNRNNFIALPLSVNFCARVIPTVPSSHPDEPALNILSSILSSCFLHKEIREKGGAYGGGAGNNSGKMVMYSYYDPNTIKTIKAFDEAERWATEGRFSDEDIVEAKLRKFAAYDSPKPVSSKGMNKFLYGTTDEEVFEKRQKLYNIKRQDLMDVAQKYLVNKERGEKADSIFGEESKGEEMKNEGWKVVVKN